MNDLKSLMDKVSELEEKFWVLYDNEEADVNELLALAMKIIRLKGNIIMELNRINEE